MATQYGSSNIVVIIGEDVPSDASILTETLVSGDSSNTGVLTGVFKNLKVYHVFENEVKSRADESIYDEQVAMRETVLLVDELIQTVGAFRN